MDLLLVFVSHLFFATTFTVTKVALSYGSPLFLAAIRLYFGGIILYYTYWITDNTWKYLKEASFWKDCVVLSLCMAYIPYAGEYWSMTHLSSIKTVLLYNLTPFVTALLSYGLLGERLTTRQTIGMVIGFIGTVPLFAKSIETCESVSCISIMSNAEITMLFVLITAAFGWIYIRQAQIKRGFPVVLLNSFAMIGGGILAGMHAWYVGTFLQGNLPVCQEAYIFLKAAFMLTLFSTIGHTLYSYVVSRFSATFVSLTGLTIPVFTSLLSTIVLGEVITKEFVYAMILLSVGLFLFYSDEL